MITCAQQNALDENLPNASFRVLDWAGADLERLGWKKRFRLVFASRTPAVYNRSTLEKMTEASSGYCCLLTQVTSDNSVRRELAPLVDDTSHDGAELNDHFKRGGSFTGKIKQIAHQNQVAGGGNGQKFR